MEQRGVTIEEIDIGNGDEILRGDRIRVCYDLFLRRGDAVETGVEVAFKVGERRIIAGLEYGVVGMRVGGVRRITVPPHLGYGEAGIGETIPPNALLVFIVHVLERKAV